MADREGDDIPQEDIPIGHEQPVQRRRLPLPPAGEPTDAQLQEQIDAVVEPLYTAGVPAGRFTVARVLDVGLTVDQFVRYSRSVFGGKDADYADLVICAGIRAGVCKSMRTLTVESLWDVIRWARTNEGRQALETRQKTKMLLCDSLGEKRTGTQSVQDVALCQILNLQMSNMAEELKEVRAATQEKIDEVARQLRLKREAQAKALEETKARFFPANAWTEPAEEVKNQRCWESYVAALRLAGQPAPVKGKTALKLAINGYKEYVDVEFKTQFVQQHERRIALQHFADDRIQYLSGIGESKKSGNFRRLLAALGVEPTVAPTDDEAEGDDAEDTSGAAAEAREEGLQQDTGGGDAGRQTEAEGASRGKRKTQSQSERRNLRSSSGRGGKQIQIQGAPRSSRATGSQHRGR